MRKIFLSFVFLLWFLINVNIFAINIEFTQDDAIFILTWVQGDINNWNVDNLIKNISTNASLDIKEGIISNIKWKNLEFIQELKSFEILEDWKVQINALYAAKWLNWNVSGFSNYYVLELVGDRWMILDTDFFQFTPNVFNIFGPFLPYIMLFWFIFFIWMLNDCTKREIENKWMWVLLIIFVPLWSFIYFFTWRKKFPLKEKYISSNIEKVKKSSSLIIKTILFWILFFIILFVIVAMNMK